LCAFVSSACISHFAGIFETQVVCWC